MVLYKKEREFFEELLKQVPTTFFKSRDIAPYLWTFEVTVDSKQLDQYNCGFFTSLDVKGKTFKFWKPTLERYIKRDNRFEVELSSSNGMYLYLQLHASKGIWNGHLIIRNYNKPHRWSTWDRGGYVTRTFCHDYTEWQVSTIKCISLW